MVRGVGKVWGATGSMEPPWRGGLLESPQDPWLLPSGLKSRWLLRWHRCRHEDNSSRQADLLLLVLPDISLSGSGRWHICLQPWQLSYRPAPSNVTYFHLRHENKMESSYQQRQSPVPRASISPVLQPVPAELGQWLRETAGRAATAWQAHERVRDGSRGPPMFASPTPQMTFMGPGFLSQALWLWFLQCIQLRKMETMP